METCVFFVEDKGGEDGGTVLRCGVSAMGVSGTRGTIGVIREGIGRAKHTGFESS